MSKELIRQLHQKNTRAFYLSTFYTILFGILGVIAVVSPHWWICVPIWMIQAYIGHAILLGFHEASHFIVHPNRKLNEINGIITGTTILTPLTAYRWVHNQHHMHIGTPDDTELWPYVDVASSRFKRILAAIGELFLGCFYTPLIFLRGIWVEPNLPSYVKMRLKLEYSLIVIHWTTALFLIAWFDVWFEFVVGYLVGAWGAGNLQSWRKLTEHLGMLGNDVPSTTRTVIDKSFVGRLVSRSLFHIDLHGPHHQYSKIPCSNLPAATELLYYDQNVYRHYHNAIFAMIESLPNPRVGSQWK